MGQQPPQISDRARLRPPPQLPQLWASQPRTMTPNTPFTTSSRRSASVTPLSSTAGSRIMENLSYKTMQPPLRRIDSDPGLHRGFIDPALRLRQSIPAESKGAQPGQNAPS